jgi:hypothetical protein
LNSDISDVDEENMVDWLSVEELIDDMIESEMELYSFLPIN